MWWYKRKISRDSQFGIGLFVRAAIILESEILLESCKHTAGKAPHMQPVLMQIANNLCTRCNGGATICKIMKPERETVRKIYKETVSGMRFSNKHLFMKPYNCFLASLVSRFVYWNLKHAFDFEL